MPYHKSGQSILLGRDPDDFSVPALAWNERNELICEGIEPVTRGAYGSVDGIRDSARNRKAARDAMRAGAVANAYLDDADFAEALAAIPTPGVPDIPLQGVVSGRFGGPLKQRRRGGALPVLADQCPDEAPAPKVTKYLTEEYLRNLDAANAKRLADRR